MGVSVVLRFGNFIMVGCETVYVAMATSDPAVDDYEPTGDSEHVAYGKNFYWTCACGSSAAFLTSKAKAMHGAESHERYCDGTATVRVNK